MNDLSIAAREHLVTWDDPARSAESGLALDGLAYLNAILRGELPAPPIAKLLDFRLEAVEEGRAVFVCTPQEFHYNPIGMVHGGLAATLIDSAAGCAVHSTLKAGERYATIDFTTHLVRAMRTGTGPVRCEAKIVHMGGSIATAEARITDEAETLIAYGHETCRIFRGG